MCMCCVLCLPPNTVERDLATFKRPSTPNHALAAAPGLCAAAADREGPVFDATPDVVLEAVRRAVARQPRTFLVRDEPHKSQLVYVQRTFLIRFPDTVNIWAAPVGGQAHAADGGGKAAAQTALVVFSASAYGVGDMGVNRRRVDEWIAAVESEMRHVDSAGAAS